MSCTITPFSATSSSLAARMQEPEPVPSQIALCTFIVVELSSLLLLTQGLARTHCTTARL